jgi:hypothetical protein
MLRAGSGKRRSTLQQEFWTRRQLVEELKKRGLPIGKGQLDKLIWSGEGPATAGRWGNRDVFEPKGAIAWAISRIAKHRAATLPPVKLAETAHETEHPSP